MPKHTKTYKNCLKHYNTKAHKTQRTQTHNKTRTCPLIQKSKKWRKQCNRLNHRTHENHTKLTKSAKTVRATQMLKLEEKNAENSKTAEFLKAKKC